MPRKYQSPKLEVRRDVKRPFYFVRVIVPKITKDGRKRKREVHVLGFVDEVSKKEALSLRAKLLDVVNAGRLLLQSQISFRDLVRQFLEVRVPQLSVPAQKKYRTQIANHILPMFGALRLSDIDRPSVEAWLHEKETSGLSWWSRVDLKGVLSAIFTAARDWKLWEGENPTKRVRIGRKRLVREKRLLKAEELRTLLAILTERPKFIVLIIFGLGLRISEVLGLKWLDVDFEAGTITIRRRWYRGDLSEEGATKSEASGSTLRLGPSLLDELRRRYPGRHRHDAFLFQGDDGFPPDDRDLLREEFRPALRRLGLYYPGFGWHAFRRLHITWRQQVGGATPLEAQRAARHASLNMTYLYTLTDAQREVSQQQAMFDQLLQLDQGKPQ